uniref:Major histocompatibility complex class I-related gene protein-like n=1 Tax=Ailuropoda melanoleuca TaxID=9646 RepID=A0A7N5KQA5_AILME
MARLLLLGAVVAAVALPRISRGASSHSRTFLYMGISEADVGLPHFAALGYVDGQPFSYYDTKTKQTQHRVPWMEKVEKDDPQYWERSTQIFRVQEDTFRENLEILRHRYNQSEGFHTLQWMYGCELRADGSKGGFSQEGYDGRTFITFDKEMLSWVAPDPQAQITKRKWDADPGLNQQRKFYLEEICAERLQKALSYGKESLLRKEPPVVTMEEDGMETHLCRAHGFYPKEIDASWRRDGEVWLEDTHHGFVAPNPDGTFHYWLSIRIDPKERDRYRCHVEHDGFEEPLEVALKESSLGLILGCVAVAAFVLGIAGIAGIWVYLKRRRDAYKEAPTSDGGSTTSSQGSNPAI